MAREAWWGASIHYRSQERFGRASRPESDFDS
jgi:hypothetical protein